MPASRKNRNPSSNLRHSYPEGGCSSVLDPWRVLLLIRVPASGAPADLAVMLEHWSRMQRITGNRMTVPAREAARLVSMKGSHS